MMLWPIEYVKYKYNRNYLLVYNQIEDHQKNFEQLGAKELKHNTEQALSFLIQSLIQFDLHLIEFYYKCLNHYLSIDSIRC